MREVRGVRVEGVEERDAHCQYLVVASGYPARQCVPFVFVGEVRATRDGWGRDAGGTVSSGLPVLSRRFDQRGETVCVVVGEVGRVVAKRGVDDAAVASRPGDEVADVDRLFWRSGVVRGSGVRSAGHWNSYGTSAGDVIKFTIFCAPYSTANANPFVGVHQRYHMGTSEASYVSDMIIAQYEPASNSDPSMVELVNKEAANHSIPLVGVQSNTGPDESEVLRILLEDVEANLDSVSRFQRALATYFRFETFRQTAVESTTTIHSDD